MPAEYTGGPELESQTLHKPGMVPHACLPSRREVEAGKSEVERHLEVQSEFQGRPGLNQTLSQKHKQIQYVGTLFCAV